MNRPVRPSVNPPPRSSGRPLTQPRALTAARALFLLSAVPFLVVGLAARFGPRPVRHAVGAELPAPAVYALTHRLPAAALWLASTSVRRTARARMSGGQPLAAGGCARVDCAREDPRHRQW